MRSAARDSHSARGSAGRASRRRGRRKRSFWRELPLLIVVALVIALVVKTFVVQAFFIPSGSMENTLRIQDKILVNKLIYHIRPIQPGDIVVFDGAGSWNAPPPADTSSDPLVHLYDLTLRRVFDAIGGLFGTAPGQTDYVKRVIGVPGDHVACCNARGEVTINGVALHEQSYLYPGNKPGEAPAGEPGHFRLTVPPGRLWVLGDHRAISDDSRGHEMDPGNGTIPVSAVIGRAFMIVWPPSHWRVLRIPSTFLQAGIVRAGSGHGSASGPERAQEAFVARGVRIQPSAPLLPLGAGLTVAVPLTWVRRRWLVRRSRPDPCARRRGGPGLRGPGLRLPRRGRPGLRLPRRGRLARRRPPGAGPALGSTAT
jgi:signal peptidase I